MELTLATVGVDEQCVKIDRHELAGQIEQILLGASFSAESLVFFADPEVTEIEDVP